MLKGKPVTVFRAMYMSFVIYFQPSTLNATGTYLKMPSNPLVRTDSTDQHTTRKLTLVWLSHWVRCQNCCTTMQSQSPWLWRTLITKHLSSVGQNLNERMTEALELERREHWLQAMLQTAVLSYQTVNKT